MSRYTLGCVGEKYEIRDVHTHEPFQVSFDSAVAAETCARIANAIEVATVAQFEEWLAA